MFKTKEQIYWNNVYHKVVWTNKDKELVRKVIQKIVNNIQPPTGLSKRLTRINWNSSYIKNNNLEIYISLAMEGNLSGNNFAPFGGSLYFSKQLFLEIPFSEFRDEKLSNLLK